MHLRHLIHSFIKNPRQHQYGVTITRCGAALKIYELNSSFARKTSLEKRITRVFLQRDFHCCHNNGRIPVFRLPSGTELLCERRSTTDLYTHVTYRGACAIPAGSGFVSLIPSLNYAIVESRLGFPSTSELWEKNCPRCCHLWKEALINLGNFYLNLCFSRGNVHQITIELKFFVNPT